MIFFWGPLKIESESVMSGLAGNAYQAPTTAAPTNAEGRPSFAKPHNGQLCGHARGGWGLICISSKVDLYFFGGQTD